MKNPFASFFRARDKPRNAVSAALSFIFGAAGSGKSVNARSAMQLTTVYACVRVIAETIASLPFAVYESTDKGSEKAVEHMDPIALEKAFEIYPDVRLVVCAELYGFSGDIAKIKEICEKHGALLIEDAAEAMGATWNGRQCGSFGD